MAMNITIDTGKVRTIGNKVKTEAGNYASEVKKLYTTVEALSNSWSGADNQEFVKKVEGYKETIEALGKVVENYGIFLTETATNMEKVQSEIKTAASKL